MENPSFWADIKKFEETLAKDPSSYCFAPLAELYRKTGLLDDAISIARKGTSIHPEYVGGYMALGRAYLDKGMQAEAREALQRVIGFTPENMLAQKLLCQIYIDAGENGLLRKSLEALLSLNPMDAESRLLLESLDRISAKQQQNETIPTPPLTLDTGGADFLLEIQEDGGEIEDLEELYLLDELDEVVDDLPLLPADEPKLFEIEVDSEDETDSGENENLSPGIYTSTIAELFVAQGHHEKAIEIYRNLIASDPGNPAYENRIKELDKLISDTAIPEVAEIDDPWMDEIDSLNEIPAVIEEPNPLIIANNNIQIDNDNNDELLATLQAWLDNIRRVRECRSGRD